MIAQKVLNNNVILAIDENQKEFIVMGNAIGYKYKPMSEIDEKLIVKKFLLVDSMIKENLLNILCSSPSDHIAICEEIITYAKSNFNLEFSEAAFISLLDHINFTIERYKNNYTIQNRLYWEIKKLYQREYKVGLFAVQLINKKLCTELQEEEAANIALHFVNFENNQEDLKKTVAITNLIKNMLRIINYFLQEKMDENSINFSRLATHLQYFAMRILDNSLIKDKDDFLFNQVKMTYPKELACAFKIKEFIKEEYNQTISNEEVAYLCIHLHRVQERSTFHIDNEL